jgi:secondary thiamine-phosphate synthase enzyme
MQVITIKTTKKTEFLDITELVQKLLPQEKSGICVIYVPHTTAGVVINEGADPDVQRDILNIFEKLAPENFHYYHIEGNSPGHVKSALTGPSVVVIVEKGRLVLGTWQRIFFAEYDGPRTRKVYVKFIEG